MEETQGGPVEDRAAAEPARSEVRPEVRPVTAEQRPGRRRAVDTVGGVTRVRGLLASVVWLLAVVAASFLAVGALLVSLEFNLDNGVVSFVTDTAARLDFGELKSFDPGTTEASAQDALAKSVLVNWGIAAIVYLLLGKLVDRVVRP